MSNERLQELVAKAKSDGTLDMIELTSNPLVLKAQNLYLYELELGRRKDEQQNNNNIRKRS